MTPAVGYTEMKDSGIEWVGKIPKEWKVTRMKTILQNVSEKNHPDATVLSLYRDLGVVPKNSRDDNHNVTSEDTSNYKFVRCGDLVINKMKAWQGSLAVSEFEGIVSPAYYVCKFISNSTDKKYLHYLLRCRPYAQEFERLSTGMRVGQWDLGIDDFLRIPVICPSISEQSAIAAYLDSQCAKIDEIIAEAKASIGDYKQWKASIIYEAVTKGLDPDTEMKDSGTTWLGWIPDHWKLSKIGSLYSLRNEKVSDKDYPPLSVTMKGILPQLATAAKTDDGDNRKLVCAGDFAINSRSDRRGSCGISPYDGSVSLINTILTPRGRMHPDYYNWLFHTSLFADEFYKWGHGIVDDLWTTRWQEMKRILVTVPPYEEQAAIAAYLDSQCAKIDELSTEKQSLITDLESYKKSLIYEVVTGKRRVC